VKKKYVVSYDMVNQKRRNKVFKLLKDYGQWVQYSVFEVECEEKTWIYLEHRLSKLLGAQDTLCIYTLCQACSKKTIYKGELGKQLEEAKNLIL
jgi:CRISPR-associated protein Cas2